MSDLIDRDAAIDFIDAGRLCNPNEPRWSDNEVVNFLKSRPSTQTEIIHCKDCEHYQTDWEPHYCDIMDYMMKEDDFCSKAKKKQMPKRLIYLEDAIKALEALFVKQIKQFDYESYEKADEKTQLVCDGISYSIECVMNLPSARPQRWIPVTERLPEEDVEVLITYRYKEGDGDTSHANIDITTYGQMYFGGNKVGDHKHWRQPFEYFTSNYEVVAWMPLPKAYKGEEE